VRLSLAYGRNPLSFRGSRRPIGSQKTLCQFPAARAWQRSRYSRDVRFPAAGYPVGPSISAIRLRSDDPCLTQTTVVRCRPPYPVLFRRPYDADRESMPPARRREFSTPGGRNGQKPLSTAHPVTTCIRAEGINGHMAVGHGKGHQECEQKARRNRPFSRRVSVAEIARRFSISAQYVSTGDERFSTAFQRMATKPLRPGKKRHLICGRTSRLGRNGFRW